MQLTIVKQDNLVLVDRQVQTLDLSSYTLPENLWALQWKDDVGEIEYTNKNNETIDALPDWTTPIIAEHQRLTETQRQQQEQENRQSVFIQNGYARKQRLQREQQQQSKKALQNLKKQVAVLTM